MDNPLSLLPEESDISIGSDEELEKKVDLFQSNILTWSTRYQCLQAYCCFVLSYLSTLKFCLTVGKYGFMILVPYWVYNILVGFGAVLVDILLGRYVIGKVSRAWDMCPLSRGVLWCLFTTTFFTVIYDHMSNAYLLKYLFWSFRKELPWSYCDPSWAGQNCFARGKKSVAMSKCIREFPEEYCKNLTWELSGVQFWRTRVKGTNSFSVGWSVACLAFSVGGCYIVNYRGIRTVEKLFPFFVYPTLVLWLVLGCVTFLVPGAISGLYHLWSLEWKNLFKRELWLDGLRDTFYILGLGKLTLSFISSHGRFDDNILFDVLIASVGGLFFCVLLTSPILSVITSLKEAEGTLHVTGLFKNIDEIFIYMSEALSRFPYPTPLWSVLTYLTWFLTSSSAQVLTNLAFCEAVEGLLNSRPHFYYWISAVFAIISFCIGTILLFFPVLFHLNFGTSAITIVLLNTLVWQHVYGARRLSKDYYFMMGRPLPVFVKGSWILLPILPVAALLTQISISWPTKPFKGIVYVYVLVPIVIFVASMLQRMFHYRLTKKKISTIFKAYSDWGPQNILLRKSRIVFDSNTASKELLYRQELCNRPYTKPPEFSKQNIVQLL